MPKVLNAKKSETVVAELIVEMPLREELIDLRNNIESSYATLAEGLYQVHANAHYIEWGFPTFQEYCEGELGIKYRRVQYMVQIAATIKKLGISWDEIKGIGWTKARYLAPVLGLEGSPRTTEEWIRFAENSSVKTIESEVKEVKKQISAKDQALSGEERRQSETKYSFYLNEDQLSLITAAVDNAKSMFDVKTDTEAISEICYHWAQDNEVSVPITLEAAISRIEHEYGVKLSMNSTEELADLL